MQRIREWGILLLATLAALSMTSFVSLASKSETAITAPTEAVATPTESKTPRYVFCHSMVTITTSEKRWLVGVHHADGNKASLEASMRRLPNREMPPSMPVEEIIGQYEIVTMNCWKSWKDIFEFTDQVSLGGASRKLEDPLYITEFDMRRAVLKSYYKEGWEIAETMFPLKGRK